MKTKFFLIGGCVRDEFLNVQSKDTDYAVEAVSFAEMREAIIERGGQIFLESPEYFTIRAKVPKLGAADFVLCRKESGYSDSRHPDNVEVGTLLDDQSRRDFTINSIARDADTGEIFDPFNGRADIAAKLIRCVGEPEQRFAEDKLRLLRALRFAITKGFLIESRAYRCLECPVTVAGLKGVSKERIREELLKCFEFDTAMTLRYLNDFPYLSQACFGAGKLALKPTIRN
jgi:tRNA nucleotidyltransferase (CCA-adding enzyme)